MHMFIPTTSPLLRTNTFNSHSRHVIPFANPQKRDLRHDLLPQSQRRVRTNPVMVAKPENEPDAKISSTVERLYDTYPFPPETLLDEAPLGYNWRWHYPSVHAFCTGGLTPAVRDEASNPLRILDAGCGTGESTTFLVHQNPGALVSAIDLSSGALDVARERLQRSLPDEAHRVDFHHMSIFDIADEQTTLQPGVQFDYINCVGVIHHTPDPLRALRALGARLKPGGLVHIFVYGAHGRWEISLMQQALRILQENKNDSKPSVDHPSTQDEKFQQGVQLGRRVFAALPDGNRLKERERSRWAQDNMKDATFADMYLHPQEVDYTVQSIFRLIDDSGLKFLGFSNPRTWDPARILADDEDLLRRARALDDRARFRLVELLDPEAITHFEFFLTKPPVPEKSVPLQNDVDLLAAAPQMSDCLFGWPSKVIMNRDYFPVQLSDSEYTFLEVVKEAQQPITVEDAVKTSGIELARVRQLVEQGIVLLTPKP